MASPDTSYRPTIGLEIHAELKTRTKMFCNSKNDPEEERPNVNVCPVCLAHPGTLPTMNKEAVRHVLRVGTAVGGSLADYTEFDRKSYFYPDIPKGYQISQYEHPLVSGGSLNDVAITRVHLEEDTARSSHAGGASLVDFNRAGVPLMELVTEPVMHDAKEAGDFARELQLLLRTLGASDANLEKGEMRIEANVSVSADNELGTKVEIKNLNSFRSVERAIAFEVARQSKALSKGEKLVQETRGWDEAKQETFHQRFKEGSADYRYFPEPDLPKLVLSELTEFSASELGNTMPELPKAKRERYVAAYGIKETDARFIAASKERSDFMDAVLTAVPAEGAKLATNYFVSDLAGEPGKLSVEVFVRTVEALLDGSLSSRGAKDALAKLKEEGGTLEEVATYQTSDTGAITSLAEEVLAANPGVVAEYKAGKEASLQYLIGQVMKASKGSGNPALIASILKEKLSK